MACQMRCSGTGFIDRIGVKIDSRPLEPKEFAHPQAGCDVQKHKGPFSERKRFQQLLYLIDARHYGNLPSLRTLPHQANGIAIVDFISHAVTEKDDQETSCLSAGRWGKCKRTYLYVDFPRLIAGE